MKQQTPPPLTIDAAQVGRYTIAKSALLDARRVLAFAAGVIESGETYMDDLRPGGLAVHPGIAFSLQFEAQGQLGVAAGHAEDWIAAVHAETDLRLHAPFQVGQQVTTQGRLIGRKQISAGVHNVERYRMVDSTGVLLAEMDFNLIFRGATLRGGDVQLEPTPVRPLRPNAAPPKVLREIFIPRLALHHYTACSNIYAPIHTERRVARAAGFSDIILHGSATKAIAMSALIDAHFGGDPRRIERLYGQLRAVVQAGTSIMIETLAVVEEGERSTIFFRVLNHEGAEAVANGFVIGRTEGER